MIYHEHRLSECDAKLRELVYEYAKNHDVLVICTYRNEQEQNDAFKNKKSKLRFPDSKHNQKPSKAVDLCPVDSEGGIDWDNTRAFKQMGLDILKIAIERKIKVTWGGLWKMQDLVHFEL